MMYPSHFQKKVNIIILPDQIDPTEAVWYWTIVFENAYLNCAIDSGNEKVKGIVMEIFVSLLQIFVSNSLSDHYVKPRGSCSSGFEIFHIFAIR